MKSFFTHCAFGASMAFIFKYISRFIFNLDFPQLEFPLLTHNKIENKLLILLALKMQIEAWVDNLLSIFLCSQTLIPTWGDKTLRMFFLNIHAWNLELLNIKFHFHTRKIHNVSVIADGQPHTKKSAQTLFGTENGMWQEPNVRKGRAENVLFLCLLYAAFAKANTYAMVCVNAGFYREKNWTSTRKT